MSYLSRIAFYALFVLATQGCSEPSDAPQSDRVLSYELLMHGTNVEQALQLSEFMRPANAVAATNRFSGRLRLETTAQSNHFKLLRNTSDLVVIGQSNMQALPTFDFDFIQDGDYLVPLLQGPVANDHRWWEFVLQPGRVWDEATDHGFSRAALPFALKERNQDCIHNGVMSFLFDDAGSVSNVAFQVSAQTCSYLQFEMYGSLVASYAPGSVSGAEEAIAQYRSYRARLIPRKSIANIAADYPGTDDSEFGSSEEIPAGDMTLFGFVIDGVHYVGGCATRYGRYPYCDEMALPSYSTAKSLVGGLGLMLAESLYPGTAAARISNYVAECGDDWNDVTIEHALDATTGHFGSAESHEDENSDIANRFFLAEDHATKIDFACNQYPRRVPPGAHWVYQTWATYLAGTAINNRLKSIEGPDFDFYDDLLVKQLWEPLQLSQLARQTRRTADSVAQPFTGYGLTLLRDDIAKLAQFLGVNDGRLNGSDVLDRSLFDAIKQRVPEDPGLHAELETMFYNNGFRSYNVADILGCENPTWLVTMSGFGGINIVVMPNDTAYYYFSDGNVHRYLHAVRESHKIRSMCQ